MRISRKIPRPARKPKRATESYAAHLRKNMTKAEALLWRHLKIRQKAWDKTFKPQQVVCGYIPDFYCSELSLAVEIDGRIHDLPHIRRNDKRRTRHLNQQGVTVIRFRNGDVFSGVHRLISILEKICH